MFTESMNQYHLRAHHRPHEEGGSIQQQLQHVLYQWLLSEGVCSKAFKTMLWFAVYCVTVCNECICNNEVEMHRCECKGKLVFSLKGFLCLFEVHVFNIRDAETLGNNFSVLSPKWWFISTGKLKPWDFHVISVLQSFILRLCILSRYIDTRQHISPLPVWPLVPRLSEAWGGYQFIWALYVAPSFIALRPQTSRLPLICLSWL